ncbi:MAG: hypothetical protein GXO11_06915, partial [Epsilonproteobacteria bacterium]|nr:hypothetical protein [Campylobacterota bacterium]
MCYKREFFSFVSKRLHVVIAIYVGSKKGETMGMNRLFTSAAAVMLLATGAFAGTS